MPILLMALLALVVFGLIGILLTVAVVVEHKKRGRSVAISADGNAASPVLPGAVAPLHPKL
ncbi:MAG: hypothetical protein ACLPHI_13215 [Terriglobales bacterium]|jgi:hypothetical protein